MATASVKGHSQREHTPRIEASSLLTRVMTCVLVVLGIFVLLRSSSPPRSGNPRLIQNATHIPPAISGSPPHPMCGFPHHWAFSLPSAAKVDGTATDLHFAAWAQDHSMADAILSEGGDPLVRDENKRTPLHHAARRNDIGMLFSLGCGLAYCPAVEDNEGMIPADYLRTHMIIDALKL